MDFNSSQEYKSFLFYFKYAYKFSLHAKTIVGIFNIGLLAFKNNYNINSLFNYKYSIYSIYYFINCQCTPIDLFIDAVFKIVQCQSF